jgi:aarF domain-containing kinase
VRSINRAVRCAAAAAGTLYDYKVRFKDDNFADIHESVAQRWYNCIRANGGLFIKFGQGIASMNHILPPEVRPTAMTHFSRRRTGLLMLDREQYQRLFSTLQDKAPYVGFQEVRQIFQEEFGKDPRDLFVGA